MKITKSRLLQIIREEVELHEKNTFQLDENFLDEEEVSEKEFKDAIKDDLRTSNEEVPANLEEDELTQSKKEEEKLFYKNRKVKDKQTGKMVHPEIEPKTPNSKSVLSVKIR